MEKWNLELETVESCSHGFMAFGTNDGCYRLAGNQGNWSGNWTDAQTECSKYGPNVHLAGKYSLTLILSISDIVMVNG